MATKRTQPDDVPPTLSPEQAIPLLRRQIERMETIRSLSHDHPEVQAWLNTTTNLLNDAFGKPNGVTHPNTAAFARPDTGPARRLPYGSRPDPYAAQNRFLKAQGKRKALLEAFVEQLSDRANLSRQSTFEQEGGDVEQNQNGSMIFIGHGRSQVWRELKDFLVDRLHLRWEEFNREPVAGRSTKERLEEMLDNVDFALIVMTAEDEHHGGTLHARENVIHEAGLFQGRLGFEKAIILLQEDCAEFSNIHGLTQIRFPKGNIAACFEEIRRVLEREKILKASLDEESEGDRRDRIGPALAGSSNQKPSLGPATAPKRAQDEETKGFLPAAQEALTLNVQSGSDRGFLVLIENESDQELTITGAAVEWNGSSLGRIHRPPTNDTWTLAAKGRLVIRWADDIHLVSSLRDLKGQYRGSFTDFVDFVLHCSVLSESRVFRKRIKVQVDPINLRMTQW